MMLAWMHAACLTATSTPAATLCLTFCKTASDYLYVLIVITWYDTPAIIFEHYATATSFFTNRHPKTIDIRNRFAGLINQSIVPLRFPLKPVRTKDPHCCPSSTPHHSLAKRSFSSPFNTLHLLSPLPLLGRCCPNINITCGFNASTYCHQC